jgi:hypothetical protein
LIVVPGTSSLLFSGRWKGRGEEEMDEGKKDTKMNFQLRVTPVIYSFIQQSFIACKLCVTQYSSSSQDTTKNGGVSGAVQKSPYLHEGKEKARSEVNCMA